MLYKGNKKFKKLYKGDELVTRLYKGDELIFWDFEALYGFKFTIDTRLTQAGALTDTNRTVGVVNCGSVSGVVPTLYIDWGDGTATPSAQIYNTPAQHTYATAGEYQITILPTNLNANGTPMGGWLSGIPLLYNARYKMKSIDTPFPETSVVIGTPPSGYLNYELNSMSGTFQNATNLASVPDNLLDNVFVSPGATFGIGSYAFQYAFENFGLNTGLDVFSFAGTFFEKLRGCRLNPNNAFMGAFRGCSGTIPEDLFSWVDTTGQTTFTSMFEETFYEVKSPIPAGLFDSVDTSSGTNFTKMFRATFTRNTTAEIPDELFASIDTSNGTNLSGMFASTLAGVGSAITTARTAPTNLFGSLDTSKATNMSEMFTGCFSGTWLKNVDLDGILPELDLSVCTNAYQMFSNCFSSLMKEATSGSLPHKLFKFKNVNALTNTSRMFYSALNDCFRKTSFTIPGDLIYGLDTSRVTNFSYMFGQMFRYAGRDGNYTKGATFDGNPFQFINAQNGVDMSSMFCATFEYMTYNENATIPTGLFTIHAPNATNFNSMFAYTFNYSNYFPGIPAGLFDLDTSNGTSFSSMFGSTFSTNHNPKTENAGQTIPAGLFDTLDTSNGIYFGSMFSSTFASAFRHTSSATSGSLVAKIPAGLFSHVDTSNGTDFSYMFSSTFNKMCANKDDFHIPSGLFSTIDTSNGTSFTGMFSNTFYEAARTPNSTVPANLFSAIKLDNVTSAINMFYSTFDSFMYDSIPTGIFGGLNLGALATRISQSTAAAVANNMFYMTFYQRTSSNVWTPVLGDVFDGETDFTWCTADTARTLMRCMCGSSFAEGTYQCLTGTANDVLQHFNFVPTERAQTFLAQSLLTDYATIPTNWK